MTFLREKQQVLGWLALIAPVPLPFNQALSWGLLVAYMAAVVLFLQRVERGLPTHLPNWVLNVLGLTYMPIFFFDLDRGVRQNSFLDPLLHLLMFLVVVKLFALRTERDKWQVLITVFFLFVGAMATSSHLAIAPYLALFLVLGLITLTRFANLHVRASFHRRQPATLSALPRRPVAVALLLVVALAVPLFAALPRFADPLVFGQGVGQSLAGYSDGVDLDQTSSIRGNRTVVMRLELDGPLPREWRFKGSTYDRYENRRWLRRSARNDVATRTVPLREGTFLVGPGEAVASLDVYLEPLRSSSLILPSQALTVDNLAVPALFRDSGGGISLVGPPRDAIAYRVGMASDVVIAAPVRHEAALDRSGITPRIEALAGEILAGLEGAERIKHLERYLIQNYAYSLDSVGRGDADPIETFLFDTQRGHCELFATAMVLLLRAEGVPARLVAGFLDAEHNPLQNYFIVRQDNAHAWVEAFDVATGWETYDPTPPGGRPSAASWNLRLALSQMYDFLIFRWDRYILAFNADDQAGLVGRVRTALERTWEQVRSWLRGEQRAPALEPAPDFAAAPRSPAAPAPPASNRWWLWLLPVILAVATGLWIAQQRAMPTAAMVYRRLREVLARAGHAVPAALPPKAVESLAAQHYPAAAAPARRLVALYLAESFGGQTLARDERRRAADALTRVREVIRKRATTRGP